MDELLNINKPHIWDDEPVFCFTSDIDWASEDVMREYFSIINLLDIKPTLFLTHYSPVILQEYRKENIEVGIHPNFLPESSHGGSYKEVIESCLKFTPTTKAFRCHRAFDVTDTNHILKNEYGFEYCSNYITIMQSRIQPMLHESGLINFPVFFEDGTHLYNKLNLDISKYELYLSSPGIKIISFHPMHLVLNSPTLKYMRDIKDLMTREQFNNITKSNIGNLENRGMGIRRTILDIVNYAKQFKILSLKELYHESIRG